MKVEEIIKKNLEILVADECLSKNDFAKKVGYEIFDPKDAHFLLCVSDYYGFEIDPLFYNNFKDSRAYYIFLKKKTEEQSLIIEQLTNRINQTLIIQSN